MVGFPVDIDDIGPGARESGGNLDTMAGLLAAISSRLTTEAGYLDGVEGLLGTGNTSLAAILAALAGSLVTVTPGVSYTDITVGSLSAGQAAGTSSVVAADATRKLFAITPASDGRIYVASSAGAGFYIPIYAGVTRILSGPDCPTNAIFVTGQTVSTPLLMAKG